LSSNTKNLGIDKNFQDLIFASYAFKEITDPIIIEIDKLNNDSNTTSAETDIYNNLKDSINSTTDKNFAQISSDYSTEVRVMDNTSLDSYIKKYQLNKSNNIIVDLTGQNINADYSSSVLDSNIKSFSSIIDDVLNAIDKNASPDKYKNNQDIINLKNVASTSKETFNTAIQNINTAIQNSNSTQASTEVRINLARKDALSSLDSLIIDYLNSTSSKKVGNENVYNAYSASKVIVEKWINNASTTIADAGISYNSTTNTISQTNKADCDSQGFWKTAFSVNANCSIGAYLINIMIQGINSLVNIVVNLAGALFDWIYDTGVIHFSSWVDGSGAYTIYKTIILSLIVSVMTFFVFYLIIRRLIDDDGENMNKILPRLILTALFVYFSFTITGWIIDQSNIITIYLYRSMTHQTGTVQTIGKVFKRILSLDDRDANSGSTGIADNFGISLGSWNAIPFTVGQLVVSIVGVFVLFEGAILILSRTIILLLCMIFSPIMLIPEGLTEFTDKYRKLVTENFTGNVMLGPVFMFLVMLAVQIGKETTKWMSNNSPSFDSAGVAVPTNFLGGIISSVLVIVVLQLAISASKSMSGSMGEKISGVVGKYAGKVGGLAFNTGKFVGGRALGGVMNNTKAGDKINDWITKGASKTGIRGSLLKGVQNYTTKYGLDGDTKRQSDADNISKQYHGSHEKAKLLMKSGLEQRASSGDKTAKIALEQINQSIEAKKNTEFKQNKDTIERETYEAEQKNKNSGGNSNGSAPVTENTKPTTPPSQNSSAEAIPKENKERGIQLHNSIPTETGKESDAQKNDELVKHEYPVNNFTQGTQETNQNNGSGNQTIHTDNLQVVADNIKLATSGRLVNQAKENSARNINEPKGFISNGAEQNNIKPKLLNNSRQEKNVIGKQMNANVDEAKKIGSTTNQNVEDIEFEEVKEETN
jgi:hypothetical protein